MEHQSIKKFSPLTSEWNVEEKSEICDITLMKFKEQVRVNAYKLIEDTLNLRSLGILTRHQYDGSKSSVLNKKETMLAGKKQGTFKEGFHRWIFDDQEETVWQSATMKLIPFAIEVLAPSYADVWTPILSFRPHQRKMLS